MKSRKENSKKQDLSTSGNGRDLNFSQMPKQTPKQQKEQELKKQLDYYNKKKLEQGKRDWQEANDVNTLDQRSILKKGWEVAQLIDPTPITNIANIGVNKLMNKPQEFGDYAGIVGSLIPYVKTIHKTTEGPVTIITKPFIKKALEVTDKSSDALNVAEYNKGGNIKNNDMKSELLRRALMSKMANGGNVGGDNPNSDVNFFTQQKMTPQQWADYGKKQGWELFETKLTSPIEEQIKRGKYLEYINPKEYTRMPDGRLVKISDVGKTIVDYKGDPTYKPIIAYGYKDTDIKDKTIESKPKGSAVILKNPPDRYFSEKNPNYTTFVKKGGTSGQMDKNIYVDNKTGKEINIDKSFLEGGKYNPVFMEQNAPVQSKKKGGMIKKYEDGGYILRAQNPGELQSMDVKDTELPSLASLYSKKSKLGKKDEIANTDGTKTETGVGESKPDLSGITSLGGELIGTGIDAYDRREGRSSIAGQSASGYFKGMAKGAAAGAAFGPLGMAIGAGIGGITGGISGAIKGKKEKKERLNTMQEEVRAAQESTDLDRRGPIKLKSYNEQDTKTGLAGLFAKGGTIKGAGTGTSDSIVTDINKKGIPEGSFITPAKNNEMAKGIRGMVLGDNPNKVAEFKKGGTPKSDKVAVSNGEHLFTPAEKEKIIKYLGKEILEKLAPEAEENEMEKKKGGEMIKRADGSYSKRGLWDNIRANKGSGKKPTPEMLKQEKKIIEEKAKGGYVVKRSSERKGKTHVVIGPDGTKKYFGDAKLGQHPNNPARKKAFYARHEKNLKKNPYFRAFARETWAEGGTVGSKMNKEMLESELMSKKAKGGTLTKSKAKEILHDKSVHGKPLTDKQRKYFGWVAGGKKNMGGIVGKYAMGGNVNKNFDWV